MAFVVLVVPAVDAVVGRRPRSRRPAIADYIVADLVLTIFYFTYTYFVISDYLARLCTFIFERYGENLGLFFGSYRQQAPRGTAGDLDRARSPRSSSTCSPTTATGCTPEILVDVGVGA